MPPRQKKERHFSQKNPPHFPFEESPFRLSMGLLKTPIEEWFEIFDLEERAFQMEEKRRLLDIYHDDIFMANPSSFAASTEVLNLMLKYLPMVSGRVGFRRFSSRQRRMSLTFLAAPDGPSPGSSIHSSPLSG